jgi:ribose transport system permease protein
MIRGRKLPREFPTLALLVILCVYMAVNYPAFLTANNLMVVGFNAAFIGIMACGQAMVILGAGLDLSVGSILAVACCATGAALMGGQPIPLAAFWGLLAGASAGFINGALITYRRLPPILTTLATLLLFRYGVSIVTQSKNYRPFPDAFNLIGAKWTPVVIFLVVATVLSFVSQQARFGRWVMAMGGNEQAVRLSGVNVDKIKRGTYMLSGVCAGLAALIVMAFSNNAQSTMGSGYELDVIAACVIGGVRITGGDGSIAGAALGAVLIALLRDMLILTNRPIEQYGLFTGGVILFAALLEQFRLQRLARAIE